VVGGQLTCVHHVVFVSGSVCFCCFWQTPLMQLSIKGEQWLSNISNLTNLTNLSQPVKCAFIYRDKL